MRKLKFIVYFIYDKNVLLVVGVIIMKVTGVNAILKDKDIKGIIDEFVDVEGLKINLIEIDEIIKVTGIYKKGVSIPFSAEFGIGKVKDNKISIIIYNVKIISVGILSGIRTFAFKKVLEDYTKYGIQVEKDLVTVNISMIIKLVPYVNFNLDLIEVRKDNIYVEMSNFIYDKKKEKVKAETSNIKIDTKLTDKYKEIRNSITKKVPKKFQGILEYAMLIPDIIALFWRLLKDKRVSFKTKAIITGSIAYLASPINLIPEFIPFIGVIDSVGVTFFALSRVINDTPEDVILQNWEGEGDILEKTKYGINAISNVVGSQNVAKLAKVISDFTKNKDKVKISNKEIEANEATV